MIAALSLLFVLCAGAFGAGMLILFVTVGRLTSPGGQRTRREPTTKRNRYCNEGASKLQSTCNEAASDVVPVWDHEGRSMTMSDNHDRAAGPKTRFSRCKSSPGDRKAGGAPERHGGARLVSPGNPPTEAVR